MKIGFDLDRVFINYPPLIPPSLIDWLYQNHQSKKLSYRFPHSSLERLFRRLTHFYLLRPKIEKNIHLIQNFPRNPHHHSLYLVSSRYQFLEDLTNKILKRYDLTPFFSSIHLNTKNEQPHFFKKRIINKLQLNLFIDDDLELLGYLKKHCPKIKLLWYNPAKKTTPHKNITAITDLKQIKKYLKND